MQQPPYIGPTATVDAAGNVVHGHGPVKIARDLGVPIAALRDNAPVWIAPDGAVTPRGEHLPVTVIDIDQTNGAESPRGLCHLVDIFPEPGDDEYLLARDSLDRYGYHYVGGGGAPLVRLEKIRPEPGKVRP